MAGGTIDTWTRTFTANFIGAHHTHTLVITEHGDGVNDPEVSATVDGLPIVVTVTAEMLIDGITPGSQPGRRAGSPSTSGRCAAPTARTTTSRRACAATATATAARR